MDHYDIIIIGTGAGGGTLLHALQGTGKKILVLERGGFLPQEKQNWDTVAVFQQNRYHTSEVWKTQEGEDLHPETGYWVGGNTKVYGAALFRLRARDFEDVHHEGGLSPAWPLRYDAFEPYYTRAEQLYQVHGKQGVDPTEPARSRDYDYPAVSHEPRIQELHDQLARSGHRPFYLPLAIQLNEADRLRSKCIRCDTCDGFPCLLHAKGDADVLTVRPSLTSPNVTLLTGAKAERLITNPAGTRVEAVDVDYQGERVRFGADIVVSACGAVNSAVLFLRSANEAHPNGLANDSDQVGRNFMKHHNAAMLAISTRPNPTVFQKTLAVNDYYWGEQGYDYPMGHVQMLGKSNREQLRGDAPFFTPGILLDEMATHSIDWWLTGTDLPLAENRVRLDKGQIYLDYTEHNRQGFERLVTRWKQVLSDLDGGTHFLPHNIFLTKNIPLSGVAHQVGTLRFGADPKRSVLDLNCKAHGIDNLYAVDGSFFPSIGAVNPSLTIMANALRVAEHLTERLK